MDTIPTSFAERLDHVMSRLTAACARTGRTPESVTLVAVTKTKPVERLQEALDAGIRDFGENRLQEAAAKIPRLNADRLRWHLIGHLQSNKARQAVALFDLVHSVDSQALATRLDRLAGEHHTILPVLLQVDLGQEATKSGINPEELPNIFGAAGELPHLRIEGLMAIPPYLPDPEQVRPYFRRLRQLRDELHQQFPDIPPLPHLSMGMSHDFEVAIEEGATMVRVGTALFGER